MTAGGRPETPRGTAPSIPGTSPGAAAIHHDGLAIQVADPDLVPPFPGPEPGLPDPEWVRVIGEDLPPEPEAGPPVPGPVSAAP